MMWIKVLVAWQNFILNNKFRQPILNQIIEPHYYTGILPNGYRFDRNIVSVTDKRIARGSFTEIFMWDFPGSYTFYRIPILLEKKGNSEKGFHLIFFITKWNQLIFFLFVFHSISFCFGVQFIIKCNYLYMRVT